MNGWLDAEKMIGLMNADLHRTNTTSNDYTSSENAITYRNEIAVIQS